MIDSLLERSRFGLHLNLSCFHLAVCIGFWRAEDMLHRSSVIDLCRKFCRVKKVGFHKVFVREYHLRLVSLSQPLCKAIFMCLSPSDDAILEVHYRHFVCIFRTRRKIKTPSTEALDKLLFCRLLGMACSIVASAFLLVCENVIGLVQKLKLFGISSLVWMLGEHLCSEL